MSKVSVIVPNYNHASFLTQRLDSIFNQTFQDFEVILMDDCSTDNSLEILNRYRFHPRVSQFIINKKNSGNTFKQWRKGINLAKENFIWIAESDDFAEPDFLKSAMSVFNNPRAGISYSQSRIIDENNVLIDNWNKQTIGFNDNPWAKDFIMPGKDVIEKYLVYQNIIPNASAVVFRRDIYLKSSGVNSKMKINGDWYLWIKLLQNSDLAFINQDLNNCRFHSLKGSKRNIENFNNIKEYYQVIRLIFSLIDFNKIRREEILQGVFMVWKNQQQSFNIKAFLKIFSKAVQIDHKLIPRLIRYYLLSGQYT
jgi:glycosyltransferase involved in cell wall biosynthesis